MSSSRGLYLDLMVEDLDTTRGELQSRGISILKEWRDHNGEFVLVADPDGNLLELMSPEDADRNETAGGGYPDAQSR